MAGSLRCAAAAALVVLMLGSCAAPRPQPIGPAPALSTAARIELVAVRGGRADRDIDAAGLLEAALRRELARRGVSWANQPGAQRYTLAMEITEYEAGDAFKRWLLPGYGATVLRVRGTITAPDGAPAGTFEHGCGVYAGGVFTIGAWRQVFNEVAADIARDLDYRIHRRGFTVVLAPWSAHAVDVAPAAARRSFASVEVRDLREDRGRIGTRQAAFEVSMGDVFFAREVPAYLSEAVADQLRAAGHRVGVEGAPPVRVDVSKFWLHTDTTMLYWDVVAEIVTDVTLGDDASRRLECRAVERTYVWPTEGLLGAVLDRCLVDLLSDLVSVAPE